MRTLPSIAPHEPQQDTYLVLDDFGGMLGCAWREADVNGTERETLIHDLLDGQYNCPVRIVAFNTSQGWSRDLSGIIVISPRTQLFGAVSNPLIFGGDLWQPLFFPFGRAETS